MSEEKALPDDTCCPVCGYVVRHHVLQDVHVFGNGIDVWTKKHIVLVCFCRCEREALDETYRQDKISRDAAVPTWKYLVWLPVIFAVVGAAVAGIVLAVYGMPH